MHHSGLTASNITDKHDPLVKISSEPFVPCKVKNHLIVQFLIYSGNDIEKAFRNETDIESKINQKMFGIDDLGEEHDKVKVYGTDINVGIELLSSRYNLMMKNGSLTFVTTNLTRKMLLNKYGARIDSRIDEMFNVFTMTGKDMRKK